MPPVPSELDPQALAGAVVAGDPRAVARAVTLVEDESADGAAVISALFHRTGRAYLVGITGQPGTGKSTLVDRLIARFRRRGLAVGVLAVDPTSPFSGGAVLGDRLRMQAHAGDAGVFIRSMATRGQLGGLARATGDAALVLEAAGKDIIVIETVGVGQDEVDIARTADVTVVVLVPGTGDDIQALKAGIMEIADIFVVNKADREGSDRVVSAVEASLSLHTYRSGEWRPPILKTVATTGQGVEDLDEAISRFRAHGEAGVPRPRRQRARIERRLRELIAQLCLEHVERHMLEAGEWEATLERIAARETDHYAAAYALLARAGLKTGSDLKKGGQERQGK
jgi:LAO/AO transport system kinase